MDGSDKMELLVIGKFQNPRCFKNVRKLPVQYYANMKAWITSDIFETCIRQLDQRFEREHREILMLVDNYLAHPNVTNLKAVTLKFFAHDIVPPTHGSGNHPESEDPVSETGVGTCAAIVLDTVDVADSNKITMLDAIRMLHSAWHQVKAEMIAICLQRAGFVVTADQMGDSQAGGATAERGLEV